MKPVIVYHPVGTVHMRNLSLLSGALPDFSFRLYLERRKPWFARIGAGDLPHPHVFDDEERSLDRLFEGDVRAVVLSIAAASGAVADLIEAAFRRGIPAAAVEEVLQSALSQGALSHYLMPADLLLVGSGHERDGLTGLGIAERKVRVTGWPFSTWTGEPAPERRRGLRRRFGLPDDAPVATLFLSPLATARDGSSSETREVRRRLLGLVRSGMPDAVRLAVKLHPNETSAAEVRRLCPGAAVIEGGVDVRDVLDATDICISRGNSQVVLEAVQSGKPVLAVPCGIPTLFHGVVDEAIAEDAGRLRSFLLDAVGGRAPGYDGIRSLHLPHGPREALEKTAQRLKEAAEEGRPERTEQDWLDLVLYRGLLGPQAAGQALLAWIAAKKRLPREEIRALSRWLHLEADISDLRLLSRRADKPYQRPLLLSGWVRRLLSLERPASDEELDFFDELGPYPPKFNRHDFAADAAGLACVYAEAGRRERALGLMETLLPRWGGLPAFRSASGRIDAALKRPSLASVRHIGEAAGERLRRTVRRGVGLARRAADRLRPPERPEPLSPSFLVLPATYRCQLTCRSCSCREQAKRVGELSPEQMLACVSGLAKTAGRGLDRVNLTGGEVFLRDDVLEIADALARGGAASIGVSTNGYLADKTVQSFRALLDAFPGIRWSVQVSIDGPAALHDRIRGKDGSFQAAMETLRGLAELQERCGFSLSTNMTISQENIRAVRGYEDLFPASSPGRVETGYTFAVDSDLFIDSRSSRISGQFRDPDHARLLRETALRLYREQGDLFALDVCLMSLGHKRFSPCVFQGPGYFLEPSGELYKCSVASGSRIASALAGEPLRLSMASEALRRISERCETCLNNCGNSRCSNGIRDLLSSDFIRTRRKVYLAGGIDGSRAAHVLRESGVPFVEHKGQEPGEDDALFVPRGSKEYGRLKALYTDHRFHPI